MIFHFSQFTVYSLFSTVPHTLHSRAEVNFYDFNSVELVHIKWRNSLSKDRFYYCSTHCFMGAWTKRKCASENVEHGDDDASSVHSTASIFSSFVNLANTILGSGMLVSFCFNSFSPSLRVL